MKTAIIGLPMVGKTSLFTILTGVHQETRIGSTAVRAGVAKVPDARLDALAKLFEPPKISHASVEYLDVPAVSKESLRDPAYVASLRVVDAFAHVLRVFEDETIPHEYGTVDPARDLENVETELVLSDLMVLAERLERLAKDRKKVEKAELPREEATEYLVSDGMKESGLERLISATYTLLGLMSFLTAGETEVRAWTIPIGSTAVKAAGAIHSDFEKKFIRAEVVNWKALVELGGYPGVREKGLLRLEGKEYIVKDGDVLVIRHG